MAFTEAQRTSIRFHLGWSARFHQSDSRLEQAMNAVDMLPDTLTLITTLMASVEDIRTKLTAAHGRLKAVKVGSIDLPGAGELAALRAEGRRHVGSIASVLGVEVRHDIFGSGRYRNFASATGLAGSNYFLHG